MNKTEVGKEAEAVVASGGLVSDELMLRIIDTELDNLHGRASHREMLQRWHADRYCAYRAGFWTVSPARFDKRVFWTRRSTNKVDLST